MNEVLDTIRNRRSIRRYRPEPITDGELHAILDAGIDAPSAMNEQPWRFVVIQKKAMMEQIIGLVRSEISRDSSPFYGAPTLVLVFSDSRAISPVSDASLAIENILLSAASIGVGSCWINCVIDLFRTAKGRTFQKELGVPDPYQCVGSVVLGYPDEAPAAKPRNRDVVIYKK